MKSICVFLGSNPGVDGIYSEATRDLGRELANRDITVVYGGSCVGLMGILANSALEAGGRVIGVIPRILVEKEIAHMGLTELHTVDSMLERKELMAELSDAFIALPGGMGTLDEFFEMTTWGQLGFHDKPCGFLDVGGFYTALNQFLDTVTGQGFMRIEHRDMVLTGTSPAEILAKFQTYKAPKLGKWIEEKAAV